MRKSKTIIQKLEEVTTPPIARFIVYYYTPKEKRAKWDDWKTCHCELSKRTYDDCLEWLSREDAQKAVQTYHKHMKLNDLSKLYETMYDKALSGDTQAAKWCVDFMKSDYFDESTDEIEAFMKDINISGLKG